MNGFVFNGQRPLDGSQPTYPKMLQKAGYQTGLFGKWHLESDPTGFDTWEIFPARAVTTIRISSASSRTGSARRSASPATPRTWSRTNPSNGWKTGTRTSLSFLVVGHKAPHRAWCPALRHLGKVNTSKLTCRPPTSMTTTPTVEFLKKNQQTVKAHGDLF